MGARTIQIEHRGQRWSGLFEIDGGQIRVSSAYGSGALPVGRRKPHAVAAEVLFGLVDDWCGALRTPIIASRIAQAPGGAFRLR